MSAEVELFTFLSNRRFHAFRACELDTSARDRGYLVQRQQALSRQTPEGCHLVGFRGLEALEPEQGLALIVHKPVGSVLPGNGHVFEAEELGEGQNLERMLDLLE